MKMKMIHRISPSRERRKLSSLPLGCSSSSSSTVKTEISSDDVGATSQTKDKCVVGVAHHHYFYHRPKEVESFDSIVEKAGFHPAADGIQKFPLPNRKVPSLFQSKVKPLSSEEGIRLMASLSKQRQRKPLVTKIVSKRRYSPVGEKKKKKLSKAAVLRPTTQHRNERLFNQLGVISVIQQNWISKNLNPRKKVEDVLRVFKLVFDKLDRDKAARLGESKKVVTSKIDCQTRTLLKEMGMQLNCEKMIGPVPGIKVGDEFQFKAQLNLIGLHFDIMGGIDYMKKGNMELATSIVSSAGNDYGDRFDNDVMIYCGEGGNVKSKDQRVITDQKLVAGNLALANSMKKKTPVRVIRGERRLDQRGKHYVYDGLYMVDNYWQEKGLHGNVMFKFQLSRIPGQPFLKF